MCNHLYFLTIRRTYPSQGKPFLSIVVLVVGNCCVIFAGSWCFNILPILRNKLLGTGLGYHMAYNRGIVIVIGDV